MTTTVDTVVTFDAADDAAVRAVVAALERAQRAEDVAAFVALFRHDAVWTTAHGRRLVGRAAIADFTAAVLPGAMRRSTARYDVTHVVRVTSDVAVVSVAQVAVDHDGRELDQVAQGRPTYVVAREGERWLLVAGQNTQVAVAP